MLSEYTMAIVKSTAPILEKHAETLTQHFYKRMFSHHPEVAPLFNPTNQLGDQQRALAGAICAYAANIDNLTVLGGAVELIAQKHASLQIQPKHYPIVGQHLIASIQEVLGEKASTDVINAWTKAYTFLADILMGREQQIYHEHASVAGGWNGFKPFRVIKKEVESEVITSFYLIPADDRPLPTYKPGQYLTVRIPNASGQTTMRNYSLSDTPGRDWFRISVKREVSQRADTPDGYVSNFLHNHIDVDATLDIAPPCGEFFLDVTEMHHRPLVLLSAGVGITPILSILLSALATMPDREIIFIHGCLNENVHAFKKVIDDLAMKHHNLKIHYCYSEPINVKNISKETTSLGFITASLIESMVPNREADYYFCGPRLFMVNIYHELLAWGIPSAQVHFEFFGPRQDLEKSSYSSSALC